MTELATGRPVLVFWLLGLLALGAGALLPLINIDTDPENMLAADQPDRLFHNAVEQRFVLHDAIVVGMVNETHPDGIYNPASLTALYNLSEAVLNIDGVIRPDLMSLAVADNITQGGPGEIRFERMMDSATVTAAQAADIRAAVERLPLLQNTLVAGDGKAAAIYVPIASKDLSYPISLEIMRLTESLGGTDEYHVTGLPVAEDTFGVEMFVQMGISAPLAGLMIFLLMWYFFRSWKLIVAPMIVAMATVIIVMGVLIGMGFTVHIMSSMIPIFLMPIAVVDSVHIMSEFADTYTPEHGAEATIREVIDDLFTPMLFTSLTSSVGFLSLMLTPIPPVRIFGAFVAGGILLAFVLTIVFIPAYVVRMRPESLASLPRHDAAHARPVTPLARGLRALGRFAFANGKLIVGATVVIIAISVAGIARIQINDNPVRWFKENHRIRVADTVLNEHFAGTYDAFLVLDYQDAELYNELRTAAEPRLAALAAAGFDTGALQAQFAAVAAPADLNELLSALDDALFEADADTTIATLETLLAEVEKTQSAARYFQRPAALAVIEKLQAALDESGLVGKSNALPDVVKVVNRELRGGAPANYVIPDSVPGVAQTLLQYQSSHRPQDLWHMVTPDFRATAIWLQLTSGDNQDMSRVIAVMDEYLAANPLPANVTAHWAGKTYINVVWQDSMVQGMVWSLAGAFAMVFVMMTALFRSWRFGLIAMLPLSTTILAVYGLIGWVGKDYDMPIAVLSSLTLGLSVDFAIHFIQRMRSLTRQTGSFAEAAEQMFEEPARAIARNAIVIALGFTPLFFAPLMPYITVGAFMASIMAISGLATLVLLPAALGWALNKET
ncbi:MAG: efflux RND transporter permease subunit [Gammaproteobacteria bacterium]|nr:efflux RND transporter permease subunit [Gammaproteobacteria bacterium]